MHVRKLILLVYWLQAKLTKKTITEADVGQYSCSADSKQTQSSSSHPWEVRVHVLGTCLPCGSRMLLNWVSYRDMLKFNCKVLRLKKDKLLADGIKSLRTKELIILK